MGKGLAQRYTYEDFDVLREIDEFSFKLPLPPKKEDIEGYGLPKEKQKFKAPDKSYVRELSYKISNKIPRTKEELDFINLQWDRREQGYWFYNNGYLEYVTGLHYYYLTAWNIVRVEEYEKRDGSIGRRKISGLPKFTDSDRDYFYIWDDCVQDRNCFGLIHITNRRDGKTFRSTATLNEIISRTPDSIAGIQSKTDTDGAKIFKKLVKSWRMLPEYFKPVDVGETDPAKRLEYRNPKKRTSKTQKKEYSEVLDSEINFGNAKEGYYDGDGLLMVFHDEIGKTEPRVADVWERWDVVRECLADGADVTGKGLLTTTVEDMEKKGGKNCKRIWDDSNTDSDAYRRTRQTVSGLKRYFKPAYYGLRGSDKSEDDGEDETPEFINEYGYSDIEAALAYLIKVEKNLSGEKLISRRRKYPRNIKDAFMISGKSDVFPTYKIIEQEEHNETLNESIVRRGDFVWVDQSSHQVEFFDNPEKGFFQLAWQPQPEEQNKISYDGRGFPVPGHINSGVIGVDPFDHKETVDKVKSNAAASYFKKFDINNPLTSNGFVMHYVGRRVNPDDFYEDMIMAAVFFGVKIICENQKPGLLNHMNRRGYKNYIYRTQQSDYTLSTSNKYVEGVSMAGNLVRQQAINNLIRYIYKFIGTISPKTQKEEFGWSYEDVMPILYGHCPFPSLLEDWKEFDANNWTVSDETVASMIALLGVTPVKNRVNRDDETVAKFRLDSFFKVNKLR